MKITRVRGVFQVAFLALVFKNICSQSPNTTYLSTYTGTPCRKNHACEADTVHVSRRSIEALGAYPFIALERRRLMAKNEIVMVQLVGLEVMARAML